MTASGSPVSGQVTLSLKDVDLLEALEAILKTKGLTYVREGNIMRVVAVAETRDQDLETRVFPLGYASGKDVLSVVEKIKSDHAKVSADATSEDVEMMGGPAGTLADACSRANASCDCAAFRFAHWSRPKCRDRFLLRPHGRDARVRMISLPLWSSHAHPRT